MFSNAFCLSIVKIQDCLDKTIPSWRKNTFTESDMEERKKY